jgi:signal transduction histidine kinase
MPWRNLSIQAKLRRIISQTSGAVLLLTCSAYFVYEYITFRQNSVREMTTLAKIIAANSTAALAFDAPEDAAEILEALKAEPHIVAACLYNKDGAVFSSYPQGIPKNSFPEIALQDEFQIKNSYLFGFHPIKQGNRKLGTLYLKSDLGAMYARFRLYAIIALSVIIFSSILAYFLSQRLQHTITGPVLGLATTARAVSERNDYSVRAVKISNDEIGSLTDSFNIMLAHIEEQNTQIQLFNQKLEQNIKERTLELEAANKELEAFSYSVSHDLRAPLRSIDGYSRVILEDYGDKVDNEGKRVLSVIIKNAGRMGQLIDDLLAFSKLGRQSPATAILDMEAITLSVVEDLKVQQKFNNHIEVGTMLPARGDSSMMKQVITNLISNAIKYSRKTENARVEIGSYKENAHHVYFVKDNGAGFDMQYYDKLFGVFQRLHNGAEFEGTGVGLALVNRIINKHNGKVWAVGKVNEGATFYFSLPE